MKLPLKFSLSSTHENTSTQRRKMNPLHSDINVCNERSCRDGCFLDFMNDAHFFGKASVLNSGFIVQLHRLEILIRERRAQLEQLLGTNFETLQGDVQIGPLTAGLVDCGGCPPCQIVKQKC